ncbi:MAG: hypothetical protein U5K55_09390 [Aliarcobacter sp.]|nr:hypothetical protein [Aliarcobacter sp.]
MNIKKIIKYSIVLILLIMFSIGIINTVVIYQIKENNITKQEINNLVSMQEKMNESLKDAINLNSLSKLDKLKEDFIKYELEFEKIKDSFKSKNENDFVDFFISDIHENRINFNKISYLLFESEKQIEEVFDEIYKLQETKIDLISKFNIDYPVENDLRKKIDKEIAKHKRL